MADARRSVAVLGATGSIGEQTLEVVRLEPERFELVAIAGGERLERLAEIAKEFGVTRIGVRTDAHRARLAALVDAAVEIVVGDAGLEALAGSADVVVNAVLGFAGLPVTLGALRAGKRLALANKESLVAAAPLVEAVRSTPGAELWPVDSEHCAIHQCLAGVAAAPGHPGVRRLIITGSGGPFRDRDRASLTRVTRAEALAHPTWRMGEKITVDSSTLMNKGLEVLEASALFGVAIERIDVVINPQSIVHSMVEFVDGSVLAQLSRPDMRLAIAYCLGAPERLDHAFGAIDFSAGLTLSFEAPDRAAFPALDLAYDAGRRGGAAPAWLNAANEVAVEAFLAGRLDWVDIVPVVAAALDRCPAGPLTSLEELRDHDATARAAATASLPG
ncbi:MAG TPA: 1-deoxy-D-xylulose-5-phosphate reductoisomerase [Acidimicrobiales bacterium]|nr:1-deoxy-D-xylulose-5-phosphate reductoisomerase [Acidimicrobiales bacterium]